MNPETNQTIRTMSDRAAICDLRVLYAHHLDSNNIAALEQAFATDAVVEVTIGKMQGIAAIQAGLNDAFKQFDRHKRGSPLHIRGHQSPGEADWTGYRRTDGAWRITNTRLQVVWPTLNNASHHPINPTQES